MTAYSAPCGDCRGHHYGTCSKAFRQNIYAAISLAAALLIISIAVAGLIA